MNQIIIKGRLTRDPELKYADTKNGSKAVCSFDVAVDKKFGEGADFFRCQIWDKRAEFVERFFVKGQEILIQGSMESRKYQDKEGRDRTIWELKANQVEFCGSKKDKPASRSDSSVPEGFQEVADDEDDIPF
ncbi:MAG: single-stranded DNA-binding protein [Eubacteriales bacterium]|nr:single-stranded DNA-binding protein [Eubacteriales bacterium]